MKKVKGLLINNIYIISKTLSLLSKTNILYMLLGFFINILTGIIVPANMYIWKNLIDSIIYTINGKSIHNIIIWLSIYTFNRILYDLFLQINSYLKNVQADLLNKNITTMVLNKVNLLEMHHFDDTKVYDNILKINNEALSHSMSIIESIMSLTNYIVAIITTASIIINYNVIIFLISIIAFIPLFKIKLKILSDWHNILINRLENLRFIGKFKNLLIDYNNIKEIKIFNIGSYIQNKILEIYNVHINENKKIRKNNIKKISSVNSIKYLSEYIFKLIIILDTVKKNFTIGSITLYINALDNLHQNVGNILQSIETLYNDNLYINSLYEFLDTKFDDLPIVGSRIFEGNFNNIELRNVYFKYPKSQQYILENINIKIEKNKSYLLIGLNGTGKTTIIKLLAGLYAPTRGEILIDGVDIKNYDLNSYRQKFSAIFQDFIKYPLTLEENIMVGDVTNNDNVQMIRAAQNAGVDKFAINLQNAYKTLINIESSEGTELSGGQWQKIALARSFFANKEILIMDEPTASLDVEAENNFFANFSDTTKHKTCVLISHKLNCAKIVDYIYVLDNHTIVEKGTFEKLISRGFKFSERYEKQANQYNKNE